MNINELTSSLYGTSLSAINNSSYATKSSDKSSASLTTESFAELLSSYSVSDNTEEITEKIEETINNLDEDSTDEEKTDSSDLMNILTDAQLAKEYLESKSGRNLIVSMVENEIAEIISGNSDDE